MRADADALAEHHGAFEHRVHVDHAILAGDDLAADVDPRGVVHRGAGAHEGIHLALLPDTLGGGELYAVVDATGLVHAVWLCGDDIDAILDRHRHDVGEVVLALCVVRLQTRQPFGQPRRRHDHEARVDLVDAPLVRACILLFANAQHLAGSIAQDAPEAGRVVHHRGHQPEATGAGVDEPVQAAGSDQRHVAVEDQHLAVAEVWRDLLHRVAGALLFGLQHVVQRGVRERGPHLFVAIADDDVNPARR